MATTKATTLAHTIASTTSSTADLNYAKTLNDTGVTSTEFDKLDGLTATTTELNKLSGVTATTDELNLIDGSVTGPLSHRNMVINGAMEVAQKGTSFTGFGSAVNYGIDRFFNYHTSNGAFTISQDSSIPTGFKNSLKMLITTADTSIDSNQRLLVGTRLEGNVGAHLNWGTSNAKTVTLSFYVRSSITGTHGGAVGNGADNRNYPFTYTISSADTWERKSITIAGDQSGTWATDNTRGIHILWGLGVGTSYSASAGSWTNGDKNSATGATTNVLGTVNSTWYLTGVQLELGSVATPFESRSYADELTRCQRYYQNSFRIGQYPGSSNDNKNAVITTAWADGNCPSWPFFVPMCHAPTVVLRPRGFQDNTGEIQQDGSRVTGTANDVSNKAISYIGTSAGNGGAGKYCGYSYELKAELV